MFVAQVISTVAPRAEPFVLGLLLNVQLQALFAVLLVFGLNFKNSSWRHQWRHIVKNSTSWFLGRSGTKLSKRLSFGFELSFGTLELSCSSIISLNSCSSFNKLKHFSQFKSFRRIWQWDLLWCDLRTSGFPAERSGAYWKVQVFQKAHLMGYLFLLFDWCPFFFWISKLSKALLIYRKKHWRKENTSEKNTNEFSWPEENDADLNNSQQPLFMRWS